MADPLSRAALACYRGAGRALAPAIGLLLVSRTRVGKEDARRRPERLGRPDLARPDGPLVWVHAASVGETVSVLALIRRIAETGACVLLTTGTVTSARVAAGRLPPRTIHQFAPIDIVPYVGRFLDHWRPDLVVTVESEIWPATVGEVADRGIPQVVVNARLSARSSRRWLKLGGLGRAIFGRLALVLAQSQADGERLRAVGAGPVIVVGNLKFDVVPPEAPEPDLGLIAREVAGRPVWLAASTHPGEEEIAADLHRSLAERFPGLLTVMVPRHPERGAAIRAMLAERGLKVAQRSAREAVEPATDVLLGDTIGEMGLYYRLSRIAFMGGTITPTGGHNPIEAAALDTVVLHGPDVKNAVDVYRAFDRNHAAVEVADAAALSAELARLLADPVAASAMASNGRRIVRVNRGALDRTMTALAPHLERILAGRSAGDGGG